MSLDEREQFLQDLMDGRLDAHSDEAQARFEKDHELAREWRELVQITQSLSAGRQFERDVLAEALASRAAADSASGKRDRELVAEAFTKAARSALGASEVPRAGRNAGGVRGRRAWLASSAAAACLVVLAASWALGAFDRPPPEDLGALGELSPSGVAESFELFRWTIDSSATASFTIEVRATVAVGEGEVLAVESGLPDTEWRPAPTYDSSTWPDSISWSVTAYDATGGMIDTDAAVCRRRGR
ncbi:MAG: hypothetical protein AB8H80_00590 [Planctomycetota bacterium]